MSAKQVFVSHVSEEWRLAAALKKNIFDDFLQMVPVFVSSDKTSIEAGKPWFTSITEAILGSELILVLCSRQSIARPWINFECGAAWLQGKVIVPLCHGDLQPAELPPPLSFLQARRVGDHNDLDQLYAQIAKVAGLAKPKKNFRSLAKQLASTEVENTVSGLVPVAQAAPAASVAPIPTGALANAIDEASLGWTLCFIGEDQASKVAELLRDLKHQPYSENGTGKRFASGFAYLGIGPTLAWARACGDPMYLLMQRSIDSFTARWDAVKPHLKGAMHCVSLGIGSGQKDRHILRHFHDVSPHTYFFPVDMSAEMLRLGIKECQKNTDLRRSRTLPIQIDFSAPENIDSIRRVVHSLVGAAPIMYSFLGNTLANFENDAEILQSIATLVRPQDALFIEVAHTEGLSSGAAESAIGEYRQSPRFCNFALSALDANTNIPIDPEYLDFVATVDSGDSIVIRTIYRNRSGHGIAMRLADQESAHLAANDTICLMLTRKYTEAGIRKRVAAADLQVEHYHVSDRGRSGFGMACLLLRRRQNLL